MSPSGRSRLVTTVVVGLLVDVGVCVAVGVAVLVDVAVGVGVPVAVEVGVGVPVAVEVGVGVFVGVAVGVGVGVAVAVGTVMLRVSLMVLGGLDAVMTTVMASNMRWTPRWYLQLLVLLDTVRDVSVVVDMMRLLSRSVSSYLQYASTL